LTKKGAFSVWGDYEFWMKWFNAETKNVPEYYSNLEDFYFSILTQIANQMQNLSIDFKTIVYCVVEKLGSYYIRDNIGLLTELKITIIKDLTNMEECF
jgi:hypothetical protein